MNGLNSLVAVLRITREHRRVTLIDDAILCDAGRALNASNVRQLRQCNNIIENILARGALDQNFNRAGLATAESLANDVVGLNRIAGFRQHSIVYLAELNVAR